MIKAIVIDDEVHCVDTLSMLLADYCPEVEIIRKCYSSTEGLEAIETLHPDVVFLDIEMPVMNGFELLERLKEIPFRLVFTTSYDQYAIKAIRFSAMDYLLKPIDAKELIAAVHKVISQRGSTSTDQVAKLLEQITVRHEEYTRIASMLDKKVLTAQLAVPISKQRRLAAIMFTDIVGYSATMQKDERMAVAMIKRHAEVLNQSVTEHEGELLNDYGDGALCAFASSSEALECAYEVQLKLQKEPVVPVRMGLHIGEIFFEDGKIMGDGVNLTSRIQSLGQEHTILFSEEFQDKIRNVSRFQTVFVGSFDFKNVHKPLNVYALCNPGITVPDLSKSEGKLKPKKDVSRWKKMFGWTKK